MPHKGTASLVLIPEYTLSIFLQPIAQLQKSFFSTTLKITPKFKTLNSDHVSEGPNGILSKTYDDPYPLHEWLLFPSLRGRGYRKRFANIPSIPFETMCGWSKRHLSAFVHLLLEVYNLLSKTDGAERCIYMPCELKCSNWVSLLLLSESCKHTWHQPLGTFKARTRSPEHAYYRVSFYLL